MIFFEKYDKLIPLILKREEGKMKKRFSKFFGTRQFYKLALAVAVPLMMQQLITSSVNLVDNLMNSAQPPDTSKSLIRPTSRIRLEEMQLHMRRD